MGLGIEIRDRGLDMGIGIMIGDLGLGLEIGDWGLGLGIRDWDWRLGLGIGIGD